MIRKSPLLVTATVKPPRGHARFGDEQAHLGCGSSQSVYRYTYLLRSRDISIKSSHQPVTTSLPVSPDQSVYIKMLESISIMQHATTVLEAAGRIRKKSDEEFQTEEHDQEREQDREKGNQKARVREDKAPQKAPEFPVWTTCQKHVEHIKFPINFPIMESKKNF